MDSPRLICRSPLKPTVLRRAYLGIYHKKHVFFDGGNGQKIRSATHRPSCLLRLLYRAKFAT